MASVSDRTETNSGHNIRSGNGHTASTVASEYALYVESRKNESFATTPCSGEVLHTLNSYLIKDLQPAAHGILSCSKADLSFHTFDGDASLVSRKLTSTDELEQYEVELTNSSRTGATSDRPSIVILRGHQQAHCLNLIGGLFEIDPHFFNAHLSYQWPQWSSNLFAQPSLPSVVADQVTFCIATLGTHGQVGKDIAAERHLAAVDMYGYQHVLTTGEQKSGESVVRMFNLHTLRHFSIEQHITASLIRHGDQWRMIIWSDIAGLLDSGLPGPRSPMKGTSLLPTVRRWTPAASETFARLGRNHKFPLPGMHQTARHSITDFGATLDPLLASEDPLYALSDIVSLSADSLNQLLNICACVLDTEAARDPDEHQEHQEAEIIYHQRILKRLSTHITQTLSQLDHFRQTWPHSSNPTRHSLSTTTLTLITTDFSTLQTRTDALLLRCRESMAMCMHAAQIEEARKNIEQARKVTQLTFLAFFYIPLSFTTSFFGMNVTSLGQADGLPLWPWLVMSACLLLVSLGILGLVERLGPLLRGQRGEKAGRWLRGWWK
ncbi:hypothetical protein BDZ85DRAFT_7833 [Elsinoe ampelina]|uniref:Cora-like Mg2+ transporter protein-domain-containing protein n=1 Tax=Elsinoe ampelina TaxID=302913 RepID=A0A6A6GPX3_9PEZI|nr:hypothetical protein BDZ85DRAFT_7833 [Elsinoe ampelina]